MRSSQWRHQAMEIKKFNVVHFVGGKENSGAFKVNILHKDLIKNNVIHQ